MEIYLKLRIYFLSVQMISIWTGKSFIPYPNSVIIVRNSFFFTTRNKSLYIDVNYFVNYVALLTCTAFVLKKHKALSRTIIIITDVELVQDILKNSLKTKENNKYDYKPSNKQSSTWYGNIFNNFSDHYIEQWIAHLKWYEFVITIGKFWPFI